MTLVATSTTPAITIHVSPGPGPVNAKDVGAFDAAGAGAEDGTDADDVPETATVAGARVGVVAEVAAGVVGVVEAWGLVGVDGEVDPVVAAGADVVGVVETLAIWTTVNPPTLFPDT